MNPEDQVKLLQNAGLSQIKFSNPEDIKSMIQEAGQKLVDLLKDKPDGFSPPDMKKHYDQVKPQAEG